MSEPREGRWLARPMRAPFSYSDLAPCGSLVFFVAEALSWLLAPHHPGTRFVVLMAALFIPTLGLTIRELWSRRPLRRDRLLVELPAGRDDFPVRVVVGIGGRRLGADRGVVWFADGAMGFVGERLSFLLAAEDLMEFDPNRQARRLRMPIDAIRLRAAKGRAYVALRSVGYQDWAFRYRLTNFRQANAPYAGERQWPPLVSFAPPPTPSSSSDASVQNARLGGREDEEGASLRDRLEHAIALQDDVEGGALRVGELDQR